MFISCAFHITVACLQPACLFNISCWVPLRQDLVSFLWTSILSVSMSCWFVVSIYWINSICILRTEFRTCGGRTDTKKACRPNPNQRVPECCLPSALKQNFSHCPRGNICLHPLFLFLLCILYSKFWLKGEYILYASASLTSLPPPRPVFNCFEFLYDLKAAFNVRWYYCLTKCWDFSWVVQGTCLDGTGPLKRPEVFICFDPLLLQP